MNNLIKWLPVLALGAFFSCNKYKDSISLSEQGNLGKYGLTRSDTFTIEAVTWAEDSIPVSNLNYFLLGQMNDPLFGDAMAGVAANLYPVQPGVVFPSGSRLDSAVLFIPYPPGSNFYGNPATIQQISAYRLKERIKADRAYYSSDKSERETQRIGFYRGLVKSSSFDSMRYGKGKILFYPGLRMRLSSDFADILFRAPASATQSRDAFAEYIRGIALVPDERDLNRGEGGVALLDLNPSQLIAVKPRILVYYNDTAQLEYEFGYKTTAANFFKTEPRSAALTEQLSNPAKAYSEAFAQAMAGCKTHLRLPYLGNIVKNGNVVIHKAELIAVLKDGTAGGYYPAPVRLNLGRPFSLNRQRSASIIDFSENPDYGGVLNNNQYRFNITFQMQKTIGQYAANAAYQDPGLLLFIPTDNPVSGSRAVFDTRPGKTRLVLTYTKLND